MKTKSAKRWRGLVMEFKGWGKYNLGDVCSVTDCQHKTAPIVKDETQYRMLRTSNIRNGKIDAVNTRSVTQETYVKWSTRGFLKEGDVILTREAPMGEVGIIRKEKYKFFLGQRLLQLKAKKNIITPDFLFYSLQGRELQHQISMNEGTGSVVSNIRIPILKKMEIYIPDLDTQEKITTSLKAIDEKIALNELIISNLEQLAQSLFKRWFIDFEFPNKQGEPYKSSGGEMVESQHGIIPWNWEIKNIGEISAQSIVSGKTPSTKIMENYGKEMPFITIPDMHNQVFAIQTARYLSEKGVLSQVKKTVPAFSICVSCIATPGLVVLTSQSSQTNQQINTIIPNEIDRYFVFITMKNLSSHIRELGSGGSTTLNLNKSQFAKIKIVYPTESVRQDFHEQIKNVFDMILNNQREIECLKELRDTLLPKLLSGEIELPDQTEVTQYVSIP